ncbi:MAG: hypothetical protein RLZZ385_1440 [Pseudomonadota bacterium]|jgi:hypothetical protein
MNSILRADFWIDIENWPIAWTIGGTWWFPLLESIHVVAITLMLGSLLMVDLRLLGLAANRYPIRTLHRELVPWTWATFVVATITGLGMFITRAASHVVNPAFQWKVFLLLLAFINMLVFHIKIYKNIERWDAPNPHGFTLRTFGAVSLLIWSGVMLSGRWVGHIV